MAMDWLGDLIEIENTLRSDLVGLQPIRRNGRRIYQRVMPKLYAIQAALDDRLCGRNDDERSWMDLEVRMKLPVFSHLKGIYAVDSLAES